MSELALRLIAENKAAHERGEDATSLDLGRCGLTEIPEELFECVWLEKLTMSNSYLDFREYKSIKSNNKGPNNNITAIPFTIAALQSLKILQIGGDYENKRKISGEFFLNNLTSLQSLDLSNNQISDGRFLENLTNLKSLDLRANQISDGHFLEKLTNLQALSLSNNQISDGRFLEKLTNLQVLSLSNNQINDVIFLKNLTGLQILDLSNNQISDGRFLENLTNLKSLYLNHNQINDGRFLKKLTNLQILYLSFNQISDGSFLENLTNLKILEISGNQISDGSFLESLTNLQYLDISNNRINEFEKTWIENRPLLNWLELSKNPIKNIPNEVFNNSYKNGLNNVKAYFKDLEKGKTNNHEVKVILIGNGSVGKTQIAKRLVLKEQFVFDEPHYSTHGITLLQQTLPSELFSAGLVLNLWDFAGQEIYHATHRLFMQTKALFVLVWDVENEKNPYHTYNGKQYLNEKLTYWLEYTRCFGQNSPILVLQNKVDSLEEKDNKLPTEVEQKYQTDFSIEDFVQVSAKTGRGFQLLKEEITQIFEQNERFTTELLKDLPVPWAAIRDKVRVEQGLKKISIDTFREWCAEQEVGDSTTTILHFLHDTGVLYNRAGYFNDFILLDQNWAISAIYSLLDRDGEYYESLEKTQGKLTYKELCKVWKSNTDAERELFIDFMLSCELCFETTENNNYILAQRTFVVPAMLRESKPKEVVYTEEKYKINQQEAIEYRFLPKVFMQRFIIKGHRLAQVNHIWQHGILLQYSQVYAVVEANYEERIITIKTTTGAEELSKAIKQELEAIVNEGKVKASLRDTGFDPLKETENYWGFLGLIKKDIPNKVIPLPLQKDPVVLLTFADNGLLEVKTEAHEIYSIVKKNPLVEVQKIENITVKTMAEAMFNYGSQLLMFHFGGHSKQSHIHLQGTQRLDKIDLARTLEPFNKPTLQLVFLNSCQSYGHVNTIASKGVKAIIATNEKINDVQAALFSNYFYQCFFKQESTLRIAFGKAETWAIRNADSLIDRGLGSNGEIFTKKPKISDSLQLFNLGELNENEHLSSPWTLFIHSKHAEVLNWTLQDFVNEFNKL